mmetsp:Transcript_18789/g.40289  ORF Transcript_18789/g.40289 Transcript_18789/m.40289 type:complete len:237 (-) Transcript_18789:331-1041(-)
MRNSVRGRVHILPDRVVNLFGSEVAHCPVQTGVRLADRKVCPRLPPAGVPPPPPGVQRPLGERRPVAARRRGDFGVGDPRRHHSEEGGRDVAGIDRPGRPRRLRLAGEVDGHAGAEVRRRRGVERRRWTVRVAEGEVGRPDVPRREGIARGVLGDGGRVRRGGDSAEGSRRGRSHGRHGWRPYHRPIRCISHSRPTIECALTPAHRRKAHEGRRWRNEKNVPAAGRIVCRFSQSEQ